jgi:hypothetical protein
MTDLREPSAGVGGFEPVRRLGHADAGHSPQRDRVSREIPGPCAEASSKPQSITG